MQYIIQGLHIKYNTLNDIDITSSTVVFSLKIDGKSICHKCMNLMFGSSQILHSWAGISNQEKSTNDIVKKIKYGDIVKSIVLKPIVLCPYIAQHNLAPSECGYKQQGPEYVLVMHIEFSFEIKDKVVARHIQVCQVYLLYIIAQF